MNELKTYKLKINRVMHTRCTHDISGERLYGIREVMVRIPLSLLMNSRYHCLNLNSVFQKGTVELRLFNSTTHTGNIKAYIQLCMAISAQALNQRCASRKKTQTTNENHDSHYYLYVPGRYHFKTAAIRTNDSF